MVKIQVLCPKCQKSYDIDEAYLGKRAIRCRKCDMRFVVSAHGNTGLRPRQQHAAGRHTASCCGQCARGLERGRRDPGPVRGQGGPGRRRHGPGLPGAPPGLEHGPGGQVLRGRTASRPSGRRRTSSASARPGSTWACIRTSSAATTCARWAASRGCSPSTWTAAASRTGSTSGSSTRAARKRRWTDPGHRDPVRLGPALCPRAGTWSTRT